ncbi:Mitoferrin [Drechslerella dactyloides]|uniref:Mitochondrial glycine transporter n=1 Tax=Drechslerella dactyloides TaxID=74499 RepID=A0AAD6IW34_DREDA|nr:Mitoferrin [Drechslerella dactyloides]
MPPTYPLTSLHPELRSPPPPAPEESDAAPAPAPVPAPAASGLTLSNNLKHFSSGLAGGVVSAIVLQPADLLKTRVQQSHSSTLLSTVRAIVADPSPVATLWRGSVPSAIRTGFGSGLYFASLNALRKSIQPASSSPSSQPAKLSTAANLITGSAARIFAGFLIMPVTVIKVRYESTFYSYTSLAHATRDIAAREGLRGFFAGFGATAVRDGPYAGVYVSFYEASKGVFQRLYAGTDPESLTERGAPESATLVNLSSGLTAGVLATAVTNPFDALKTRIQLFPETYSNMWVAGRKVIGEEGFRALFDGLGLRMARKALSSAVMWTAYEEGMRRWEIAARRKGSDGAL